MIHVLVLDTGIHAGMTVFWTPLNLLANQETF